MIYKVLKKQYNSSMCFVCGMDNEASLRTKYYELENKQILGLFQGGDVHQSYPKRMHGGIITALLDETIGRAVQIDEPNTFGVTVELTVRYLKPVPLDETLYCVGKITDMRKILFYGEGYLCTTTGDILATCHAKYMKQDIN
ncbi:MAG TPA: PaaI family thioesterase [Acholeplasmataceae bacterium]|nr:PaaI family thioesterase [Acholeplasmataceae bacterium]